MWPGQILFLKRSTTLSLSKLVKRYPTNILGMVQKAVKEHLEEIENQTRDQIVREIEMIKMEIDQVKAQADLEMESLRNQSRGSINRFTKSKFPSA